jgi:tripartite ATP-independent transporter DctP family solute receptor
MECKMKKEISLLVLGILIGSLISTCGFAWFLRSSNKVSTDSKQQVVLKLGHSLDTSHPVHKGMVFMKKRLEEISKGTVTIDIYPGSVLGSEVQCIEQLQNGSLAMTKTSAAAIENFVPEMSVFGMPYLFRDVDHYWAVLKSELGTELLQKGNEKFLKGLCYYDSGSRNFYTKDRPVLTPDDLEGMKIRVVNSRTAMDMVELLGAAPTPIAWGELYTALAQGIVDGAENNPPSFTSNKHYEVCKHFSLDAHTRIPDLLLISTKVWDRLDTKVQKWVQMAADESSDYQRELWSKETLASLEKAKAEGVTVYKVDQGLFAEKVEPMYERLKDKKIKRLIKRVREVRP